LVFLEYKRLGSFFGIANFIGYYTYEKYQDLS
jgi:hypothetical protein